LPQPAIGGLPCLISEASACAYSSPNGSIPLRRRADSETLAQAFRNLEGDVGEAYAAPLILELLLEAVITDPETPAPRRRMYELTDEQETALWFAVSTLRGTCNELRANYYRAWGDTLD
jgi:hypothetical protein